MNENLPATQQTGGQPAEHNPFSRMMAQAGGINAGSVAIESERAIAEAQGKMVLAKRFPRSNANSRAEFMEACADPEFAATAFYAVKNRGSGPSIRFAEEVARCYQNFDYGHRELSRSEGKSEVEVYAWDMERNNFSRRQITVEHVLDTQDGPRKLKNQGDIDNRIANIASKQVRGRILALMPKALVQAGIARCKLTIAGGGESTVGQRVTKMVEAFSKFGVTTKHLEAYIGHQTDTTTIDELADLIGIFNAIREGAKASDYFKLDGPASGDASGGAAKAITDQVKNAAGQEKGAANAPNKAEQSTANARKDPAAAKNVKAAEAKGNVAKEGAAENSEKGHEANKPSPQSNERPEGRQPKESSEQQTGGEPDEDIF